jgi:hypothetical protein
MGDGGWRWCKYGGSVLGGEMGERELVWRSEKMKGERGKSDLKMVT